MKNEMIPEGYTAISNNALKTVYFEAMHMYTIEDNPEALAVARMKLGLGELIYTMAAEEDNLSLMLIVLDGANIIEDFDLVAKASTWITDNTVTTPAQVSKLVKAVGFLAKNREPLAKTAINAGIEISKGFEEIEDLALTVNDEPYAQKDYR